MTMELSNPWLDYSAAVLTSADQAVASTQPPDAAANQSCGGVEESPASIPDYNGVKSPALVTAHGLSGKSCPLSRVAPGPQDALGSPISDVGELFHFARMLCAEARIHPGFVSPEAVAVAEEIRAYEAGYYDPPPLFLRTGSAGGWR